MSFPHRFSAVIIGALMITVTTLPAAVRADVFEVKNVAVDVKAKTAADARNQALRQAERRAFYHLISRLTLNLDQERIPELGNEEIQTYVRDFSVAREKASSVRYIARLNYRFKPGRIRELLRAYGVPFAETKSKPVAILPVFETGSQAVLWDEPNPWRSAWQSRDEPEGLVPLIVPIGDLSDIAMIGVAEALAGDPNKLSMMAERYGAVRTMVTHLNLTVDTATGRQAAAVTLLQPSEPIAVDQRTATVVQREAEDMSAFMARTASQTAARINSLWKHRNLISATGTGVLAITVPIGGLEDWLKVKKQLAGIGIIRHTDIVLMSLEQVRVNVHYAGGPEQLSTALDQANLSLQQEGGEWIVMPVGAFQPPKT